MKGKTSVEKGITLIALIITIVVLLILAAVAISSITNDGILSYATNAAKDYNQAVRNEQMALDYFESFLIGTANQWIQNGTKISKTTPEGTTTLTVGDYVNYVSGVSGYTDVNGWQILGVENGQILLMSSKDVVSSYTLEGADDYFNGVAELNSLCTLYGNGEYADSAKTRSVNVEDINRVTGYNPERENPDLGEVNQYGNEVTFTLTAEGRVAYTSDVKSGTTNATSFTMPDGTILGTDMDSVTLKMDHYIYTGLSYLTDTSSNAYKLIFDSDDALYWLGSVYQYFDNGTGWFGMQRISQRQEGRSWFMAHELYRYKKWAMRSTCSNIP